MFAVNFELIVEFTPFPMELIIVIDGEKGYSLMYNIIPNDPTSFRTCLVFDVFQSREIFIEQKPLFSDHSIDNFYESLSDKISR